MHAALGLRAHSGWAAAVLVGGTLERPVVLDRRRLVLADVDALAGSMQPYHAMEGRAPAETVKMLARFVGDVQARASDELRRVEESARAEGHRVAACGLLIAAGRALPELSSILASHALIHTADGLHFRGALERAAAELGWTLSKIPERDVETRAAGVSHEKPERMKARIAALGKGLGPPWTADQKLAALAGLLALAAL
jgi:hypothetical protein